jgi:hypothetical protein
MSFTCSGPELELEIVEGVEDSNGAVRGGTNSGGCSAGGEGILPAPLSHFTYACPSSLHLPLVIRARAGKEVFLHQRSVSRGWLAGNNQFGQSSQVKPRDALRTSSATTRRLSGQPNVPTYQRRPLCIIMEQLFFKSIFSIGALF